MHIVYTLSSEREADNMKGEVVIKAPVVHGNGAHIVVPRRWLGWVVRCEVVRRNKENKR